MSYSNAIIPIRLTRETDHPKEYLCITGNLFLLNARYVMLHNGINGTLFKLKGAGPRFMSKETLQKKGFESLGHDYYLVYTFDTTQSKDYNNLSTLARGKQTTAPWFATWEELMNNVNQNELPEQLSHMGAV